MVRFSLVLSLVPHMFSLLGVLRNALVSRLIAAHNCSSSPSSATRAGLVSCAMRRPLKVSPASYEPRVAASACSNAARSFGGNLAICSATECYAHTRLCFST